MKKTILALSIAGILTGCGGDEQTIDRPDNTPRSLTYSYPVDAQTRADGSHQFATTVPASGPMYLRFTKAVTTPEEELADKLILTNEHGDVIDIGTVMLTAENKGLAVTAAGQLDHGTTYSLQADGLEVGGTIINLTDDGIVFRTAPDTDGPMLGRTEGEGFQVARVIPVGGDQYPITDFTVPRIQLTEPVDESSLVYGDTISLRDSAGELVPAEVHVKHHRITVDPDDYLTVGEEYTLTLTEGVKSALLGNNLTASELSEWTFTPVQSASPSGKRQIMAQQAQKQEGEHSITKAGINSVNLASTLLGQENPTTATGTVFAELGYIPRFESNDQNVPLSIGRGALMTSDSVEVKVAGAVPAGFESEDVYVRFLSDANGFLSGNPYTDYSGAPRTVELYIDMALNTENTIANSALGQELMHVQLVGTAMVVDGLLNIEAVGVIEPDVMGVDQASGLISFKLEGFSSSADAPDQSTMADNEAPKIKSWVPGDNIDLQRPSDPVIVYFSEPVLPSSITSDNVKLIANDGSSASEIAFTTRVDGSALVINPSQPLAHGTAYSLQMANILDLSENAIAGTTLDFQLDTTGEDVPTEVGPIALTTLPGYPCAKTDMDISETRQGRCLGGITETTLDSTYFGARTHDDLLPIIEHPENQPIIVRFSQDIAEDSVIQGTSFIVEKLQDDGSWKPVSDSYTLETSGRQVKATPIKGWQPGATYSYTLTDDITNTNGVPLYSKLLSQYADPGRPLSDLFNGGHDLENRFVVTNSAKKSVLTQLKNLPTKDVNANLDLDEEEIPNIEGIPANSGKLAITEVESTVVGDARIGCAVDAETCETFKKFIFKTADLDVEVGAEAIVGEDGVTRIPVKLHPSILLTTSSEVNIQLDNDFLAALATDNNDPNQKIPTGPMVMRMRYQGDDRNELIDGYILQKEGQLTFETELDLYMDAPYLNSRLSGLANTRLEDNMRSFPINGLKLSGAVTFLDDGRMVIEQRNVEPIILPIQLRGQATVSFLEDCGIFQWFCDGVNNLTNAIIDVNTDMTMQIASDELHVRYVSPYTQE